MRILLIHQYFLEDDDPGGSRFNEMTRYWMDDGHRITVLAGMVHYSGKGKKPEYQGKYFVPKKQGGVDVLRCHVSESYNKNFAGRLWGYFSFMLSSLWGGLFRIDGKFDLILVTSPPLFVGITAWIISRIKRIPYVFEVRDLWPESAIDTGVLKNSFIIKLSFIVERFIYQHASLINVLTPAFRAKLIDEKGIDPDKIIFIPNAADFTLSDALLGTFDRSFFRNEHDLNGRFVITYVGAHGVANHLIQLIEVAERLQGTNVLFLLIGDGMQKPDLISAAMAKNLQNIRFIDPVPKKEVFRYILASDMGTSVLKRVDTFKTIYSNKTFDYMACKVPVLLLVDGVSRQLVEEADCGVYAEPENVDIVAQTVISCMNDPERIAWQGINGYRYAKQHFDREKLAITYISEISKLVQTVDGH